MTTTNLSFLSKDGKTTIHAVKWTKDGQTPKAILQISHGMIEYIERYEEFANFLTEQGFMVVGHDHLGHGQSVLSQEDWGYFADENSGDILVEDIHTLRTMIQKEYLDIPYYMLGHSMGSYLLRKYLLKHHDNLRGAIISGTGFETQAKIKMGLFVIKATAFFHKNNWRYRSQFVADATFGGKAYKGYDSKGKDLEKSWLSKNIENLKEYFSNPACTFIFTLNGYRTLLETVLTVCNPEKIVTMSKKLPVLFVAGKDDPVGNLGAGVIKTYDMFKDFGVSDVTYQIYDNARHEILNEPERLKYYDDILSWMNVRIDT